MFPFSREILSPEQKSYVTSSPQVFNAQFYHAFRPFPLDPQLNISQHRGLYYSFCGEVASLLKTPIFSKFIKKTQPIL